MKQEDIFTTQELAKYLKLNEKTVIKMAQNGHLPGVKIGNQWRFHLKAIDNFLLKGLQETPNEELDSVINADVDIIPLSRLTSHNLIELDSEVTDMDAVLKRLAKIAYAEGLTPSKEQLFSELKKREQFLSTSIGNGLAIPHSRHPSSDLFSESRIVILISKKGIDCDAPDARPVHIFFMPCASSEQTHIRLLARIARFFRMDGAIEKMIQAETKDQILQILLRFDKEHMFAGIRSQ